MILHIAAVKAHITIHTDKVPWLGYSRKNPKENFTLLEAFALLILFCTSVLVCIFKYIRTGIYSKMLRDIRSKGQSQGYKGFLKPHPRRSSGALIPRCPRENQRCDFNSASFPQSQHISSKLNTSPYFYFWETESSSNAQSSVSPVWGSTSIWDTSLGHSSSSFPFLEEPAGHDISAAFQPHLFAAACTGAPVQPRPCTGASALLRKIRFKPSPEQCGPRTPRALQKAHLCCTEPLIYCPRQGSSLSFPTCSNKRPS